MKNMLKPIALFFSALHSYPSCTFCSEFLLLQGLSSLLSVFFSPHRLIIKLIITISSAKLFFQLFWFFPPFPLAFMGSGFSCIGWPPLPQGLPRSCKWPVWVFFLRTPVLQKPHLCPLAWFVHFRTVLPVPVPLHMLFADQLPFPPPPPLSTPSLPSPPHELVIWHLPFFSFCTALLQFQFCLFH